MQAAKLKLLTEEEYLEFEASSAVRHEYVSGRIFAMTGNTQRHNTIQLNVGAALHHFLEEHPCRPFMENMKVRIKEAKCFYYPDVMVACSGLDDENSLFNDFPVLVIEVLSQSTAAIDRREKLNNYLTLESLREYVLVHQNRRKVELFRKTEFGDWEKFDIQTGADLVLNSMPPGELRLPMNTIYRNVKSDGTLQVKQTEPEYLPESELFALSW